MRIQLETIPTQDRDTGPAPCGVCERKFAVGKAAAWAYSDDGVDFGPTCPACLEAGPEGMRERLESRARWDRRTAEQLEQVASEEITAPTVEELRLMERITA